MEELNNLWPRPTDDEPHPDDLMDMLQDSICPATDGCTVEPDGICEHGHPSWFIYLGVI